MENISSSGGNRERLSHCTAAAAAATDDARLNIGTPHMNGSTPTNVTMPQGGNGGGGNGGGSNINNNNNNATTTTNTNNNSNNINNNISGNVGGGGNIVRVSSVRRPQQQQQHQHQHLQHLQSSIDQKFLTFTIHKDSNGYGMKVSGDNPVFVESVKNGGAAQKAGLVAGDMILKVDGIEVRSEKHPQVVALIKSHLVVELTVRRSLKMQRPSSIGIGPPTPILTRDRTASITGPQPVDNDKRRELEFSKIKTLRLMVDQEMKNLENLKTFPNSATNRQDRARAEANIRQMLEKIRQVGGEDATTLNFLTTSIPNSSSLLSPPPEHGVLIHHVAQNSSPAFLSRFPRSLSSLSLGTRKQKDKDLLTSPSFNQSIISPSDFLAHQQNMKNSNATTTPLSSSQSMTQSMFQKYQQSKNQSHILNATPTKKKFSGSHKDDIPPPLPQRNPPRFVGGTGDNSPAAMADWRVRNIPVSDLDLTMAGGSTANIGGGGSSQSPNRSSPPTGSGITNNNKNCCGKTSSSSVSAKKRPKPKTKALSDPKMSTQLFLQMEKGENFTEENVNCVGRKGDTLIPPPLPPRQPGMMEEHHNLINSNKQSGRPIPNSVETLMNYPLVATCTAVRDNLVSPNNQPQRQYQQSNKLSSMPNSAISSKSTAIGQTPLAHFSKHRRVVSSPDNIHPRNDRQLDRHNKSTSGSWELLEKDNEITPPGTPPPPYPCSQNLMTQSQILHGSSQLCNEEPDSVFVDSPCGGAAAGISGGGGGGIGSPQHLSGLYPNQILAAQANTIQKKIISMEDEEVSDQECIVDEHGPFNYLQRLLEQENIAHLAVFLNYVVSNSDPAPLLFYLITGLYKEGTVKDMRKWAYEIHSTFLVPCAPLMWFITDESLAREVDNVLQNEYDKVEILRKVFWKSRKKAKDRISDQLVDFQQKRTAGLGTIYGPSDLQLSDARGDKNKEQKIFEDTLLRKLQNIVDEIDKEPGFEDARKQALCSALSTVLQRIFITRSNPGSPIDRHHHFVSREKSFKRIMGKHRKIVVRGHPLTLRQYYEVTHCNHCQLIIWGVSPQGYHCTDCKLNIHRTCSKILEESCPGPVPQKRKEPHTDNKISKFMGKIRPSHNFIQNERRMESSMAEDIFNYDRMHTTAVVRQPSDRRPDLGNSSISSSSGTTSHNTSELQTSQSLDADSNALDAEQDLKTRDNKSKSKSAPVSVNRSESYKDRLTQKRLRSNRRKTSDPSLTKTNDEQSELGLSNANYTASSSSSLSSGGSLESPSTSLEQVGGSGGTPASYSQHHHSQHHPPHHHHHPYHQHGAAGTTGAMNTASGTVPAPRLWVDSDDEEYFNEVDWSSNITAEILTTLSDAEKKRQEIINEIFQTERNHVRTLKVLEGIFFQPLKETGLLPSDHLQLLFPPALLSLKDLHFSLEQQLKQRRIEHNHIVQTVGDLLVGMFEGQSGDELREHAAQFCARQQIALEALKEKRRKDENLQRFLTKAESHKACRRLQLKDLLPTVLQRLTKYPLLFENLYKITIRVNPNDNLEADSIQRALVSAKRILVDVNQAVKIAEDTHKLQTIQRKLDRSSFDKECSNEFKNLDLTQYKLIHDGQLTMKKNPGVQLHGLLFENMMVLVHKQDDKYLLKYFPNTAAATNETNKLISPITSLDQQTLVRQSAVDKNTFFLIITKTSQMLELRAPSSSECKTWFKHISDAAEHYKPRSKNNQDVVEDPASTTLPHSNTKESLEGTPERTVPSAERTPSNLTNTTGNNNLVGQHHNHHHQQQQQSQSQQPSGNIPTADKEKQENNLVNNNNINNNNASSLLDHTKSLGSRIDDGNNNADKLNDDQTAAASAGLQQRNSDRRDSIYSNNSNNTRTLMQHCPLLEPSEIQISISPAHMAEPILTPAEQLRRLDDKMRDVLAEKQKIICDMFRVPNEHFTTIVDVAAQPEAPKDSSDIALAAFAQVQSLAEVLTEYMKCGQEQEISAVSTAVCDQCHQQQQIQLQNHHHHRRGSNLSLTTGTSGMRSISPLPLSIASTNTGTTVIQNNSYEIGGGVGGGGGSSSSSSNQNSVGGGISKEQLDDSSNSKQNDQLDDTISNEYDDGYCEIDELRLPSVGTSPYKQPQVSNNSPPDLIKRQSTVSADSIPEESEQDIITQDEETNATQNSSNCSNSKGKDDNDDSCQNNQETEQNTTTKDNDSSTTSEFIEINEAYVGAAAAWLKHTTSVGNFVDQETALINFGNNEILCGPNRLSHASSLEPSVPCHILNGFVTALNAHISLLLPKINERDLERESLRRENQHLRELLNAMHERKRVDDEKETPDNVVKSTEKQQSPPAETDDCVIVPTKEF